MSQPTPIPDAVADLKVRQMPARTRAAVLAEADAKRRFALCRTEYTRGARELAIADITRARKVLANVPERNGGAA